MTEIEWTPEMEAAYQRMDSLSLECQSSVPAVHGSCDGLKWGPGETPCACDCHQAGSDTMAQPFTDADVERLAEVLYHHWHGATAPPFADRAEDIRAEYMGGVRLVLSALAAAGRLRHPDGWWETPPPLSDGRRLRRWVEPWQPAPTESEDR